MNSLLIAVTALLSVLLGLAVVAVSMLGALIMDVRDLKAYVMTVISKLPAPMKDRVIQSSTRLTDKQIEELRAKLKGTQ